MLPRNRFALRAILPVAIGLAAPLLSGCGGASTTSSTVLDVQEADFHITAPQRAAAGEVTLRVHNNGPDQHELLVVRAGSGPLPIRPDGFTVDEEALQHSEPGALEPGESGATRELHLHLAPGRYVLFCNMAGHYLGGMHTTLAVSQ